MIAVIIIVVVNYCNNHDWKTKREMTINECLNYPKIHWRVVFCLNMKGLTNGITSLTQMESHLWLQFRRKMGCGITILSFIIPSTRHSVITLAIPFSGLKFQQACTSMTFMKGKHCIFLIWLARKSF